MGMKMKRKQLWKPLLGLAMMGTAVVVLAVQSFAEQDTIPAITWVTTASEESAESALQTEPLETEADSVTANRQPVFDWDKPTKAETTTKSAGSTTAPVRQTEPAQPDAAELVFPEEAEPEISYPLDLNAATAEELETLPGCWCNFSGADCFLSGGSRRISDIGRVTASQWNRKWNLFPNCPIPIYNRRTANDFTRTGYTAIRIIRADDARGENGIRFRIHSPSGHQHRHGRGFSKAAERHAGTGGSHCSSADTDSIFSKYL